MSSTPMEPDPTSTQAFGAVGVPVEPELPSVGISPQDRAAIAALPPGTALLLVQQGPTTGARFLLDSAESTETTVGRHPRADIFLDDVTVSRKHALFTALPGGGFSVRDQGSLNGTYVNRQRVEQAALRVGDEVQIGKYRMTYHPSPRHRAAQ
ncbi:FHA domain-containing protein [Actinomyces procaprae]|uniref:FHA domain-containing protein n=1 Tax=Actinomyces procaprae TaxID=2560010 RepID=UPI00109D913A|nr:FHA domain-containing protein [Actinomyces procaprae]